MPTPSADPKPRHAIVVLLDSLNRHMLGAYGSSEFDTPNLDRLARRSLRFDRHVTGSLPCMPARHDILCGALDFLWKPWGSIELWEDPITYPLRRQGVTTMLASDHPHLFETGGENYHTDFAAWEYLRGHEGDPWKSRPDPSWLGHPTLPAAAGVMHRPYDDSRTYFKQELDFPGPRTMQTAADWLDVNAGHHDRFLLFVDEFDPHEPFDTPPPWANRYDPGWEGDLVIWPPYAIGAVSNGVISERTARHVRANYGSKLSMIDHWLGRLLDRIDAHELWQDSVVILCTDHGHYLGEKDLFGKPRVPHS
jgi:arylsulfatase A-like enzyme